MVWLMLVGDSTVIEVPLTAVTSPLTMLKFACPLGVGLGLGLGRGLAPAAGPVVNPPAVHPAAPLGARRTVVAVMSPVVSFTSPLDIWSAEDWPPLLARRDRVAPRSPDPLSR